MRLFAIASSAFLLAGCAGAPRVHDPILAAPAADEMVLAQDISACRASVAERRGEPEGRALAAGASGAAAATATMVAGIEAVFAGAVSGGAVVAAGAVAAPLTGYMVSRHLRNRAERRINDRMTTCLELRGHDVAGWEPRRASRPRVEPQ